MSEIERVIRNFYWVLVKVKDRFDEVGPRLTEALMLSALCDAKL